jgi:dUTP pyrophosphatase
VATRRTDKPSAADDIRPNQEPIARPRLGVFRLHDDAVVPQYQTPGAAAFDLHANDTISVADGRSNEVGTGLAFDIPQGWVLLIFSRSGHGFKHGVRLANCVGVIDSDYTGEVRVRLHNDSRTPFTVFKGDRIAQALLAPAPQVDLVEVVELKQTARGAKGLGSTGA